MFILDAPEKLTRL